MIARSMFIKFTDKHGRFYIEERRVWEPELFLAALSRYPEAEEAASVVITTESHYREWRWKNGKSR